jgi:lipoprotein LpqH
VKRGFVVAIGGAAIVVAGLTGCGGSDKVAAGTGKVTIDDKDQAIKGTVVCQDAGGSYSITIGDTKQGGNSGASALLTADKKEVQQVGLSLNGQPLAYNKAVPGGEAKVTQDGKKYSIEGTAIGADAANHKFKMEITCP